METVWLAIETLRESIHDDINLNYMKIKVPSGEFDHDVIKALLDLEDLVLLKSFKDEKEAKAFGEKLLKGSAQDYTKIINKSPNLNSVRDRAFLVQIPEEVTKTPRVYLMKKIDYEKLKASFPTLRLATDEEVDGADSFISCLIPLDYELVKSLRLQYFRVISSPDGLPVDDYYGFCQSFEESQKLLGELREYCILLAGESELVLREDVIDLAKKLFGDRAEETVDHLVKTLQDITAGREVDLSETLTVDRGVDDGVEKISVKYA